MYLESKLIIYINLIKTLTYKILDSHKVSEDLENNKRFVYVSNGAQKRNTTPK